MTSMKQRRQLGKQIEAGDYRPDPALVAEAMLRRRGRGLLMLVSDQVDLLPGGGPEGDSGPGLSAA